MKKSLIALAALAAAGVASAQSSVTLFGVLDLSYENVHTAAGRVSGLAPSANSSSRLGFRGVEDLGGGMSASFWLEAALAPQSGLSSSGTNINNQANTVAAGGLTFNRRSTVSLSGGFGEIRLGRDYTPTFYNYTVFDPFGTNSVGATLPGYTGLVSPTFVRASNSVGYFLPGNLGGIYGQVMYAFAQRATNDTQTLTAAQAAAYGYSSTTVNTSGNGRYMGGRIGYSQGPLNIAMSYGRTKYEPGTLGIASVMGLSSAGFPAGTALAFTAGSYTDWSIGGSYTFGSVKGMAYYARQRLNDFGVFGTGLLAGLSMGGAGTSFSTTGWGLGVDWGIGAGNVLASYSRVSAEGESASKWAVGYVHNLSKRTAVYGIYARVNNSDASALTAASYSSGALGAVAGPANFGATSYGFNVGLRHAF
jgi:predicted porin